mmetsp:Transcript_7091/g.14772  ORF Transcript_7091/g.14772 Transcript_7091/m.14772 type:complete len:260 (+) Transcript_7091:897-1676(+)
MRRMFGIQPLPRRPAVAPGRHAFADGGREGTALHLRHRFRLPPPLLPGVEEVFVVQPLGDAAGGDRLGAAGVLRDELRPKRGGELLHHLRHAPCFRLAHRQGFLVHGGGRGAGGRGAGVAGREAARGDRPRGGDGFEGRRVFFAELGFAVRHVLRVFVEAGEDVSLPTRGILGGIFDTHGGEHGAEQVPPLLRLLLLPPVAQLLLDGAVPCVQIVEGADGFRFRFGGGGRSRRRQRIFVVEGSHGSDPYSYFSDWYERK